MKWFQKQFDKIGSPELDWVQLEITTHCNTACVYCPRDRLALHWENTHMSLETFSNLVPFLNYTELIYLQGWGEPLLNPHIFKMIQVCKKRRKKVGFTTNGMLLSEETIRSLIDLRTDIISISLAGTTAETHNRIRAGTNFEQIIANLKTLQRIKAEKDTSKPAVHVSYLMLLSNILELRGIVSLAEKIGVEQIVATNLALILSPELITEALFNQKENEAEYRNILESVKDESSRKKIGFYSTRPAIKTDAPACSENISRACVVNVNGEICPCVYLNHSLSGRYPFQTRPSITHYYRGRAIELKTVSFGNIHKQNLTRIWNKKAYADFRNCHFSETVNHQSKKLSDLPEVCQYCYKCMGV